MKVMEEDVTRAIKLIWEKNKEIKQLRWWCWYWATITIILLIVITILRAFYIH